MPLAQRYSYFFPLPLILSFLPFIIYSIFHTGKGKFQQLKTRGDGPTPRERATATLVGRNIFIFGGYNRGMEQYYNDLFVFESGTSAMRLSTTAPGDIFTLSCLQRLSRGAELSPAASCLSLAVATLLLLSMVSIPLSEGVHLLFYLTHSCSVQTRSGSSVAAPR